METRANYVLIGAFTLLTAIGLLLFGLWAAKFSSERSWQQYKIVFDESVAGLSVGSPVQFNGILVGWEDAPSPYIGIFLLGDTVDQPPTKSVLDRIERLARGQ